MWPIGPRAIFIVLPHINFKSSKFEFLQILEEMSRFTQFLRGPTINQYFSNGKWVQYESGQIEGLSSTMVSWIENLGGFYWALVPYMIAYQPLSYGFGPNLLNRYLSMGRVDSFLLKI